MNTPDDEEKLLRSVALQNAATILLARRRAEEELVRAKDALELKTEELAHSLSMMRATLESTTDGILVTDDAGTVTGFNQKYVDIWGVPRTTMESRDHRQLLEFMGPRFAVPGPFLARVEEIYASAPPESFDLLELADGRVLERLSKIQVLNDRNVGRVWSFRDITERRRTEEALRDETRVLELLNRTGTVLASTLDLPTLVQAVTDAATELSGAHLGAFFLTGREAPAHAPADAIGRYAVSGATRDAFEGAGRSRLTALFGPSAIADGPIRCDDVLADPRHGGLGPAAGRPPGDLPVRSYLAVPVVSHSGDVIGRLCFGHPEPGMFGERTERLVVGVAAQAAVALDNARLYDDIRRAAEERKQLLESERAARDAAERMSAIKDEFLATLSHELRTPLSAILGWAQTLRRRTTSGTDLHKGLETIERNARVQTKLIEDLLDMSRITSGKVRLDIQPVEAVSVIEAALESVGPAADAKGIRLERLLDPTTGPISGDPHRLQQVVWNLLSNALKFTPRDGQVQVVLEPVGSHVEISVTDTGVGITPGFLPHVFERFRQADAGTTRQHGGLGLGLAIVKHLVELHGGTVRADSPGEGRGSTFTVCLPLMVVHRTSYGDGAALSRTGTGSAFDFGAPDLSGIKVLVVDDQVDARDLITRVLADCDAHVLTASTADEALRLVERERPHVLVSDIGMPDVDGFELLRRVRALGEAGGGAVPAIALTALARSEDQTRALRVGFQVHVSKPVEPSELVATVARVAGRGGRAPRTAR